MYIKNTQTTLLKLLYPSQHPLLPFYHFECHFVIQQISSVLHFYIDINIKYFVEALKFKTLCGAKGSGDPGPFHIKPKAHTEEEEMSNDEQRESRLPGYIVEDDPILGRPKSRKGKALRRQRQSPRASQRKFRA